MYGLYGLHLFIFVGCTLCMDCSVYLLGAHYVWTLCMDCSLYLLGAHYVWIAVYIC